MIGKLLRWIVMFPVPPRYSREAVATALLTVAGIALLQVHSLGGVLAAALSGAALVFAVEALHRSRRTAT